MAIEIIQSDDPLAAAKVRAILETLCAGGLTAPTGAAADMPAAVRDVIADVQARGDEAVCALTERIERVRLTPQTMRVAPDEIAAAAERVAPDFRALIRRSAENVRAYQQAILQPDPPPVVRGGRRLSARYTPIDRVGIFIPGGGGSGAVLVSSLVMTAVPAQVAGVGRIVIVSPPTVDGDVSDALLAAVAELGLDEVWRVSGTGGLAALAFGTETMPRVDKIVGPGNAFIAEAKRQLFGRVGIDAIAGPSEVLIIADETARADWLAADMLAQAEHDPGSAVLVTTSSGLAGAVAAEIDRQLDALDRADAAGRGIETGSAIIVAPDLDAACDVANAFATEHLQVITADDEAVLGKIRHAGAIFVGGYTPVPLGDYYAGPSHVLPTGTTARFSGPLSCNDFRKASSVIRYDADALAADAADVTAFARREGLTAHAAAVEKRLERGRSNRD
ncbi:MAG: histidinol dehydrogenase [Phycisphaerae bacterium]|nr:histidinol dehydrogenase [Phycisphaerae bacterium]